MLYVTVTPRIATALQHLFSIPQMPREDSVALKYHVLGGNGCHLVPNFAPTSALALKHAFLQTSTLPPGACL